MTATEELRRLLDERGVEWEDASPVPSSKQWKTSFTSFTGEEVTLGCYEEPKWIMGTLVFHTPEQAVAATLGPGTCRVESMHGYTDTFASTRYSVELSCHTLEDWPDREPPDFCPWCGARVVGEVDADGQG